MCRHRPPPRGHRDHRRPALKPARFLRRAAPESATTAATRARVQAGRAPFPVLWTPFLSGGDGGDLPGTCLPRTRGPAGSPRQRGTKVKPGPKPRRAAPQRRPGRASAWRTHLSAAARRAPCRSGRRTPYAGPGVSAGRTRPLHVSSRVEADGERFRVADVRARPLPALARACATAGGRGGARGGGAHGLRLCGAAPPCADVGRGARAVRGCARRRAVVACLYLAFTLARGGGPALLPRPRPRPRPRPYPAGFSERPAREPRRPGGPGRPRAHGRRCPRRWSPSSGSGWPTRSTARTSPSAATSPRPRGTPPKRRPRWALGCWRSSFSSSAARPFSRLFRVSGWACEVTV